MQVNIGNQPFFSNAHVRTVRLIGRLGYGLRLWMEVAVHGVYVQFGEGPGERSSRECCELILRPGQALNTVIKGSLA